MKLVVYVKGLAQLLDESQPWMGPLLAQHARARLGRTAAAAAFGTQLCAQLTAQHGEVEGAASAGLGAGGGWAALGGPEGVLAGGAAEGEGRAYT